MAVKKDGRTIDTLESFRWPFLIGGAADEEPVPTTRNVWKQQEIIVGTETYLRHRSLMVGSPARIAFFIAADWPKERYEPYELHRRILNTHPDLIKLPDIEIKTHD
jgi:hypothetical protein